MTTRARQESSTTDPAERARSLALSMLNRAPRSSADLRARLIAKDIEPAIADAIVARYIEVGLLDDRSLAAMIARTRHHERGQAPRVIATELRRKGFAGADIEAALEHLTADVQLTSARALAESRWARMGGLNSDVKARRLTAFLGRKGYPASMVFGLVRDLIRTDSEVAEP
ncbi:MAG: regulatory protein RecX [Demequinaceae bacterium]|nr:regulatory protein RecX [Demequinaceae bacterium]